MDGATLLFGWLGDCIEQGNTEAHEPEQKLEAEWFVQPGSLEFKDVFHIFERLFNFKAVVVHFSDLCLGTAYVIGKDIPGFGVTVRLPIYSTHSLAKLFTKTVKIAMGASPLL